jgi:hypothetical protein
VNPNMTEIVPEAGFEERASSGAERLAGRAQDFVNDRRSRRATRLGGCRGGGSSLQAFVAAFGAFTCHARRPAAGALALQ